jgi:hypothetical protein
MSKVTTVTPENILEYKISQDINQWLHQKGDDVHRYINYIDRVADLALVIRAAIKDCEQHNVKVAGPTRHHVRAS